MNIFIYIFFSLYFVYLILLAPRIIRKPARMPGKYYAHRGLHDNQSEAPENTMAAFRKAVEAGYGMELDVQLTKDEQVVVVHDFDLKRICGIEKDVDACTYEELQEYAVCESAERIPLLTDVLHMVDGQVPLIVEIKYKGDNRVCERVQELLDAYQGTYCVESFHPQVLCWYKKNRPRIRRGQLAMNYLKYTSYKGADKWVAQHLLTNVMTKPDFIAYDCRSAIEFSLAVTRKLFNCPTFAWTVRSQRELEACRPYFDYFIFEGFTPED